MPHRVGASASPLAPGAAKELLASFAREYGWELENVGMLWDVLDEHLLSDEEVVLLAGEIRARVKDGSSPRELLHAFVVVVADIRTRRWRMESKLRMELEESSPGELWEAHSAEMATDSIVWGAVNAVCDEWDAATAAKLAQLGRRSGNGRQPSTSPGHVRPRARQSRGRRRGPPRPSDDPDLADLRRRCPRCGGVLRALLPSPHWTCDPCAEAIWEQMVRHELERVLGEAYRILGGESA